MGTFGALVLNVFSSSTPQARLRPPPSTTTVSILRLTRSKSGATWTVSSMNDVCGGGGGGG